MTGYTPVFDSVFQGTLCGKWPDTGVWLCLLALADRHGHIDMTLPYISAVTGVPVSTLSECIDRFMRPDPHSRTRDDDGRRLRLLDDSRSWGWIVVNHGKYREKARKQMQQIHATESGRDAERKRIERESGGVRRSPAKSSADRPSDSDSDSDLNSEKNPSASATPSGVVPRETDWFLDFKLAYPHRAGDQGWRKAQRAAHARQSEGHTPAEFIAGARRYAAYCEATQKAGSEFVKQACTFLGPDKPFLQDWTPPASKAQLKQDKNIAASLQWLAGEEAKDAIQ